MFQGTLSKLSRPFGSLATVYKPPSSYPRGLPKAMASLCCVFAASTQQIEDLRRMYELFSRVPSTLEELRRSMCEYVKTTGKALVTDQVSVIGSSLIDAGGVSSSAEEGHISWIEPGIGVYLGGGGSSIDLVEDRGWR